MRIHTKGYQQMSRLIKWLRYSGINVTLLVNPCHWYWVPKAYKDNNQDWPDGWLHSWHASWLFVRITIWIDNGEW